MNNPHQLLRSSQPGGDQLIAGRWLVAALVVGALLGATAEGEAGMFVTLSAHNAADGLLDESAVWFNEFANCTEDRLSQPPSGLELGTLPEEQSPVDEQEYAPQEDTVLAIGRNTGGASSIPRDSGGSTEAAGILSGKIEQSLLQIVERLAVGRTPVLVCPMPDSLLDPPKS